MKLLNKFTRQTLKSARNIIKEIVKLKKSGMSGREVVGKLANRLTLWQNTGIAVLNEGIVNAPIVKGLPEPTYRWRFDDGAKHCDDCKALDGVILTRSEWKKLGIKPNSPQLQCGGWHCKCRLILARARGLDMDYLPSIGLAAAKAKLGI